MYEFDDSFDKLVDGILKLKISDLQKGKLLNTTYEIAENIEQIIEEQKTMKKRIGELEEYVYNDFDDFDDNTYFECPYCKRKVHIQMENQKMDIICPFCKNEVVLEWLRDNE